MRAFGRCRRQAPRSVEERFGVEDHAAAQSLRKPRATAARVSGARAIPGRDALQFAHLVTDARGGRLDLVESAPHAGFRRLGSRRVATCAFDVVALRRSSRERHLRAVPDDAASPAPLRSVPGWDKVSAPAFHLRYHVGGGLVPGSLRARTRQARRSASNVAGRPTGRLPPMACAGFASPAGHGTGRQVHAIRPAADRGPVMTARSSRTWRSGAARRRGGLGSAGERTVSRLKVIERRMSRFLSEPVSVRNAGA